MNIKTKAIKVLDQFLKNIGLMRTETHEEFRVKCEEFSKDYMRGTSGVTVGGESGWIERGTFHKTVVVCGSNVSISGAILEQGIVVAPWARNVHCDSVISIASPPKNLRAVVNCGPIINEIFPIQNLIAQSKETSHDN